MAMAKLQDVLKNIEKEKATKDQIIFDSIQEVCKGSILEENEFKPDVLNNCRHRIQHNGVTIYVTNEYCGHEKTAYSVVLDNKNTSYFTGDIPVRLPCIPLSEKNYMYITGESYKPKTFEDLFS